MLHEITFGYHKYVYWRPLKIRTGLVAKSEEFRTTSKMDWAIVTLMILKLRSVLESHTVI